MNRDTLLRLLQKMEKEAQLALANDGSFLEALQALKWEIDSNTRVRAAMRALRDSGLSVFTSFAPRIRIRFHSGERVLALQRDAAEWNSLDAEDFHGVSRTESEPLSHEVRDAASAVIAASGYCRLLDEIVNEAVQANSVFERIAASIERAGYELQICLDLSTYAQVRPKNSTVAQTRGYRSSRAESEWRPSPTPEENFPLRLSGHDVQFLKDLRIRPK
jgi:hypothetical protein